jgi:hypothetical protein
MSGPDTLALGRGNTATIAGLRPGRCIPGQGGHRLFRSAPLAPLAAVARFASGARLHQLKAPGQVASAIP